MMGVNTRNMYSCLQKCNKLNKSHLVGQLLKIWLTMHGPMYIKKKKPSYVTGGRGENFSSFIQAFIMWYLSNRNSRTICLFACLLLCLFVCFWRNNPQLARVSTFMGFLGHTQRRTTLGRTSLDEWSARRSDLYLTTHNVHNRQTSMLPLGIETTISAGERPQTYGLHRAATGTGGWTVRDRKFSWCYGREFCC